MEKYKSYYFIYTLILVSFFISACTPQKQHFPKDLEPQQVNILRFDQDFLSMKQDSNIQHCLDSMYTKYGDFTVFFFENILGISHNDTSYIAKAVPMFLNDTTYGFKETNAKTEILFNNIDTIQQQLNQAFARINYLFPQLQIPNLYFIVSGFNASILFYENDIVVGLDMYLGSDYELYNRVVHEYQKYTMRKECIVCDVVSAYLFKNIPFISNKNRLLENMIFRGKIMYLISLILDNEPAHEIMGYSPQQWEWCLRNERYIWNAMMDKRDLFKSEHMLLVSYLNDGPFTSEISQDAPSRLGTWIGWRIAESYVTQNDSITLLDLIYESDAQKILENSYYKP